jgi:SAM-dependent methyltransferase
MREHLGPSTTRRILDIGCGDGLFFPALEEFGIVEGLEMSGDLVRPSGPYQARISVAPFDDKFKPGKEYELILMLDVLEHLADAGAAVRHAADLLATDGHLVLTVPALNLLWTNHDTINHHRTRYRRKTLRPLLRAADLVMIDERYWYQWTCPVKLGVRVMESVFRLRPRPPSIPPQWVNSLLFSLSRFEQRTLGAWGVAFGSSLVAVCRKGSVVGCRVAGQ